MRLLLELVIAAALIALAWQKSWKERVNDLTTAQQHSRSSTLNPRPTATVSGAWMWDPNRKTALDRPSPTPPPRAESTPY
jgi:hypothetical protein